MNIIELETGDTVDAAIIWLHGLGASGEDFIPLVPELRLPDSAGIRFLFPNAPQLPVTVNGGYVMPAWYDILEMDIDRRIDQVQLLASARAVAELIDEQVEQGIDSRRIMVAGFSQGGAVSYQVALTYPRPLAGLIGMSTYFATADTITPHRANGTLAIQLHHGSEDPVVPEMLGQKARDQLVALGYQPEYLTYPMEHTLCMEEVANIARFVRQRLSL
ncbi:alpha/beta hydrolase [Sedimenticola thiotaurini]|uniref:Carboxylesterase n=1 Tax=Sedimenticola thiotaurini TaxID=1543721 RepID=A0A0F7JVZ9_9GAMM|nr:alpha/beta fold hydrolase [Sedimenticola thiotaurini]AKH19787.1 carboxylesterase [Sedimenticola thiotaurini]